MLAPIGLRLSEEKTRVCHIDEGFDFLGWRIQRRPARRGGKRAVYTYPSKKIAARDHGQGADAHPPRDASNARRPAAPAQPGAAGLVHLLPATACPRARFSYLDHFAWWRVVGWLRKRHHGLNWGTIRRRFLPRLGDPRRQHRRSTGHATVAITRYRYRGARIRHTMGEPTPRHEPVESRMRGDVHVRFGGRAEETDRPKGRHRASARPLHLAFDLGGLVYSRRRARRVLSRKIVGWSMRDDLEAPLVVDALAMAIARRKPRPGLVHHSDRGSQYTSIAMGRTLRDSKIMASMGSIGDPCDNATAES